MKPIFPITINTAVILLAAGIQVSAAEAPPAPNGITLPEGYKDWRVIATMDFDPEKRSQLFAAGLAGLHHRKNGAYARVGVLTSTRP